MSSYKDWHCPKLVSEERQITFVLVVNLTLALF